MKYEMISGYAPINEVGDAKVAELAESMRDNGWVGAPILCCNCGLITGSHRLAALQLLESDDDGPWDLYGWDVAEDVTDEVNAYCEKTGDGYEGILKLDELSVVFGGTRIEQYKDQIAEW